MAPIAIAGAIPLAITYYNVSPTFMQTIFMLPTLTAVPSSLLIGALSRKTGKKLPLQIGILAMLISGLAVAAFNLPLAGIIIAMAVMGLGLGCLMTLNLGIIPDHFEAAEQGKAMAHVAAFANIGGMILSLLGGVLLAFGWQHMFWMFILAAPIIIINHITLPKEEITQTTEEVKGKIKLNTDVLFFCMTVFFIGLSFAIRNANAGLLVEQHNLGDIAVANYAMTLWTAVGIVMGFIYGVMAKIFKQAILPIAIGVFAVGMALMGNATAIWVFYLGNLLSGMGIATVMPTILSKSSQSVDATSATFVISLIFATLNIAGFVAPALVNTIARTIATETAQVCFNIGAISLVPICLFAIFRIYMQKSQVSLDN